MIKYPNHIILVAWSQQNISAGNTTEEVPASHARAGQWKWKIMHFASLVPRLSPHVNKDSASNRKLAGAWEEASTLIVLTLVQELNVSGVVVSVQDVWPWTVGVGLTARIWRSLGAQEEKRNAAPNESVWSQVRPTLGNVINLLSFFSLSDWQTTQTRWNQSHMRPNQRNW